jgi:hypothetical protein
MLTVDTAISRFRRDLTLGWVLRAAFMAGALACFAAPLLGAQFDPAVGLGVVAIAWVLLSFRGVRGARLAAASPSLISSGRFEEAEQQIDEVLRGFSLSKTPKLLSLHHLAVLRHAQRRWEESAVLSKALLRLNLGPTLAPLNRPARLILADSLLELGDTRGAQDALAGLLAQNLSLTEAMNLLSVQLDYQSRVGAWDEMLANVMPKVQMAEIMQARNAARVQALLALAAWRRSRPDLSDWLRKRAELLADPNALAAERPVLRELSERSPSSVVSSQ